MGFLDDDYLLETSTAINLYSDLENLPIVDPYCRIEIEAAAANNHYTDIWQFLIERNHQIWPLLRRRGINENQITGDSSNWKKWKALANVVPDLAGNPLYELIHLELKQKFGIELPISASSMDEIWEKTRPQLHEPEMRPLDLLSRSPIDLLATPEDPFSKLEAYTEVHNQLDGVTVRPIWRPDTLMQIDRIGWEQVVETLGRATNTTIDDLQGFLDALKASREYFTTHGCMASDHVVREPVTKQVLKEQASKIYERALAGESLTGSDIRNFQAFLLDTIADLNQAANWVMQLHVGVIPDYRDTLYQRHGADAGGDISTPDINLPDNLRYLLNKYDDDLTVVVYTANQTLYHTILSIARTFTNVHLGAPWHAYTSPVTIQTQLEQVGSIDLFKNFPGMASHSSRIPGVESRFEIYRRSLANVFGTFVERGQLSEPLAQDVIQEMAYSHPVDFWETSLG